MGIPNLGGSVDGTSREPRVGQWNHHQGRAVCTLRQAVTLGSKVNSKKWGNFRHKHPGFTHISLLFRTHNHTRQNMHGIGHVRLAELSLLRRATKPVKLRTTDDF